jgi:hypothetical protein
MARDRSEQALAWPLVSDRRGCRDSDAQGWVPKIFLRSGLERIFGCPLTVEGHRRTLSGPSPDLSPARAFQECRWFTTHRRCYLPRWHSGMGRQAGSSRVCPAPGLTAPPARVDAPTSRSVGVGTSSRAVQSRPCAGPIFQACQHASGAVQRLGSRFGSSHRGVAMTIDLPLRMKDDRPGLTMTVHRPCSEYSSRRRWTQVHERE